MSILKRIPARSFSRPLLVLKKLFVVDRWYVQYSQSLNTNVQANSTTHYFLFDATVYEYRTVLIAPTTPIIKSTLKV